MTQKIAYPTLRIDTNGIYENTREVVKRANEFGVDVTAVTKCTGGNIKVAQAFMEGGARAIGDSRLSNLKGLSPLDIEKWLIRIPMISEAEEVVKYSDLSLNSEIAVLRELDKCAEKHGKKHDVILMLDLGDLREGWFDLEDFSRDLEEISRLRNINIRGLGTNSNCAGAVIPEPDTFIRMKEPLSLLREEYGLSDPIVSGGNSGAYYMIEDGTIPRIINNLRLGELLLFGHETSFQKEYDYLNKDIFKLQGEIIELKTKPSLPIGKHGKDAFGKEPVFEDIGERRRAILAIGKQDIPPEDIYPFDSNIRVVTASSDHLILDVTESSRPYKVGDIISFKCSYGSALRASTSDYVNMTVI